MAPRTHRKGVLKFMYDFMVYWDARTMRGMIMDGNRWEEVGQYVFPYLNKFDAYQRIKKLPAYHTDLKRPIVSLFKVFSIDLSGPFPETKMGHKPLLVCVEHLKD